MPATRLRFFPSYDRIPVPAVNGNGKQRTPSDAKGVVLGSGVLPLGFVPINTTGGIEYVRLSTERALIASVLCYAAINYRCVKVSEAPPIVVQETDDGDEWLSEHVLAELLEEPNPDEEMADLLAITEQMKALDGSALWVKDMDRGDRPARLTAYSAAEFEVRAANGRMYGEFIVNTASGPQTLPAERVVFHHNRCVPGNRWEFQSPTKVVLARLNIETELATAIMAGLRNAVVPSLVLSLNGEAATAFGGWTPEQQEEFRATMATNYAAARNHGQPFAAGAMTATQMKLGFAGLEGGALYREAEAAAVAAYGVRPEIIGYMLGLENSPWSHMKTAQRFSYDETIVPLWKDYGRTMTRQLLRPVDPDRSHHIRFDSTAASKSSSHSRELANQRT